MRTYAQLTPDEQKQAEELALVELLKSILCGAVRFADEKNENDLQARIDKAVATAEQMQTPWFAHEYILDVARDDLEGMARCDAEDALYPDPTERIIRLPRGERRPAVLVGTGTGGRR